MNGNTAVDKAIVAMKRGEPLNFNIGAVWVHSALSSLGSTKRSKLGIESLKYLGAGKRSVAYPYKKRGRVLVVTVHGPTGMRATKISMLKPKGFARVTSVKALSVSNKHDGGRHRELHSFTMPELKHLSAKEQRSVDHVANYVWSFAKLARKSDSKSALSKLLTHLSAVEYEGEECPSVVREMFGCVRHLWDAGLWHNNVYRANLMRDRKGVLFFIDPGAVIPLGDMILKGRQDPMNGVFYSTLGSTARPAKTLRRLKRLGWDPPNAKRKIRALLKKYG